MGQIELFDHLTVCKQINGIELLVVSSDTLNYSNVWK